MENKKGLRLEIPQRQYHVPISVVGWDMDGVFIDAEPFKYLTYKMVMLEHGVPLNVLEDGDMLNCYETQCIGKTGEENAQAQLDWTKSKGYDLGITGKQYRDKRMPIYSPLEDFIPLIDKHIRVVKEIHDETDVPQYLISRTDEPRSRKAMARAGIENHFTYKNVTAKGQEKYEDFKKKIESLGIPFEQCACIEDTEQGISDIPIGMIKIAVPNYFTRNQNFSKADFVVDMNDLLSKYLVVKDNKKEKSCSEEDSHFFEDDDGSTDFY